MGGYGIPGATCILTGTRIRVVAFARRKETAMRENNLQPYTVEQLQQEYSVSLPKAVEVLDRFGGDRQTIKKLMRRCPHRDDEQH
ncbi:hypothetical protein SAMN05216358_3752 [Rhizobium sp. AN5]|nr:hypothetical protein SAMN05216358_3752 [Rhizobium sp. AN5]